MEKELETKYKNVLVDMLVYFDEFCKDNNLDYAISSGTALGAVRHGGFIPWDDDIDICMYVDDYLKLEKIWEENGDTKTYFLQTNKNDIYMPGYFFRLRKRNTASVDAGDTVNTAVKYEIPLDIFPFYNAPKSDFMLKQVKRICKKLHTSSYFAYRNRSDEKIAKKKNKVSIFYLKLLSLISNFSKKSGYICDITAVRSKGKIEKDKLFPSKEIMFENKKLRIVRCYDEYLTWLYGDYMKLPPEDQRASHNIEILDLNRNIQTIQKAEGR